MPKWGDPFAVLECIGDLACRLKDLHPVLHVYLLRCSGKHVCSTTSVSNLFYMQLIAYVFGKIVIEATLLIAGKHEAMPYTWIECGPEHAIWRPFGLSEADALKAC